MPSENYVQRPDGTLCWIWEKEFKLYKEGKNMPFKKKLRCHFCKKDVSTKPYTIKKDRKKYTVCSSCAYISKMLIREDESGKMDIVRKIIGTLFVVKKHCTTCKFFRLSRRDYCRRDNYTGIGTHTREYPDSYANQNCPYYSVGII